MGNGEQRGFCAYFFFPIYYSRPFYGGRSAVLQPVRPGGNFVTARQVAEVHRDEHLCLQLAKGPLRHIQELRKFLPAASCRALRDIARYRDRSSAHLCDKPKKLLPWERLRRRVDNPDQPHCFAPHLQVLMRSSHAGSPYFPFPISYFPSPSSREQLGVGEAFAVAVFGGEDGLSLERPIDSNVGIVPDDAALVLRGIIVCGLVEKVRRLR
jgi:hypothetical protein